MREATESHEYCAGRGGPRRGLERAACAARRRAARSAPRRAPPSRRAARGAGRSWRSATSPKPPTLAGDDRLAEGERGVEDARLLGVAVRQGDEVGAARRSRAARRRGRSGETSRTRAPSAAARRSRSPMSTPSGRPTIHSSAPSTSRNASSSTSTPLYGRIRPKHRTTGPSEPCSSDGQRGGLGQAGQVVEGAVRDHVHPRRLDRPPRSATARPRYSECETTASKRFSARTTPASAAPRSSAERRKPCAVSTQRPAPRQQRGVEPRQGQPLEVDDVGSRGGAVAGAASRAGARPGRRGGGGSSSRAAATSAGRRFAHRVARRGGHRAVREVRRAAARPRRRHGPAPRSASGRTGAFGRPGRRSARASAERLSRGSLLLHRQHQRRGSISRAASTPSATRCRPGWTTRSSCSTTLRTTARASWWRPGRRQPRGRRAHSA